MIQIAPKEYVKALVQFEWMLIPEFTSKAIMIVW